MRRRLQAGAFVLLLALSAGARETNAPPAQESDAAAHLAAVLVTAQEYDAFIPWRRRPPETREGYAAAVAPGRFVTTESLVRNHTLVELRPARSGTRIPVTVTVADPELNLALLDAGRATDGAFEPLAVATALPPDAVLRLVQFDATRNPQRGDGRIVQIDMDALPKAPYPSLTFRVLSGLNVRGEGAPALYAGALAGIVMAYDAEARIAAMIPYPVLRRFLDDAHTAPYTGAPRAGFLWKPLVDPVRRRYLGVPADGGIRVLSCLPGAGAADTLQPGDVVLEWDGYAIDALGYYADPDFGRLPFPYLIKGRRTAGDRSTARVVRAGVITNVTVHLSVHRDTAAYIPENITGAAEPFVVQGGLILRELTGRYLKAHGSDWQRRADTRLSHLYLTQRHTPPEPGDRIVYLGSVLPDPVNIGYQDGRFRNRVVEAVNGETIRNLADVRRIAERDGALTRVRLHAMGVELVLDAEALPEADARIADAYRIPTPPGDGR
jgi:hypothetical protein